ncbi:DUF3900 domain-containing protein [Paenibacillus chitinolyticus]|uniref:DUF3900 domain-containing protein n=1 Tax=Paenibacillus chitinolyticus TaxID=79263 RepID=UPI002DB7BDA7|nr:DUF3900 domain-containing protein [Paenibacillus chitinolyticus]MEC0249181.1 DUF3900 domain-containing protein [Paenibacillus chitinolyticus]
MKFEVKFISFFVIREEGTGKAYRHFQTLDGDAYEGSALEQFLGGEFARLAKRKVERNPQSEQVPTKIGRFITEPGCGLETNPNYNMFARLRSASSRDDFLKESDELARAYIQTSSVRSGAFITASAKLPQYFDEPFVFVMKCDFEPKIARITDESSLLHEVEMAINAKNMKAIQYPYMPEVGMLEDWELKIHQPSHAKYFEDLLKFVEYEKSMPELLNHQVVNLVQQHIEQTLEAHPEQKEAEERDLELWAASEKRELQEKWAPELVMEAANFLVEQQPDLGMTFKLDHLTVKGKLADYGRKVHFAKFGDQYVVLLSGSSLHFEKGVSPVELLQPEDIQSVLARLEREAAQDADDGDF